MSIIIIMSGGRSTITIENSDIPTTRQASGSGEIHLRAPPHPVMWSCCVELRPGYSGVIEGQGVIDGVISGGLFQADMRPSFGRCRAVTSQWFSART